MAVLIDLGDPSGAAGRDDASGDGPRLPRERRRALVLLALTLAALLTCSASAPARFGPLRLVARLAAPISAPVAFAGDLLLAVDRGHAERELVAIGSTDGVPRWRQALAGRSTELQAAWLAGSTVVVSALDSADALQPWTAYAFDPVTGALRWSEPAQVVGVARRAGGWTAVLAAGEDRIGRYAGRDVDSGRPLWRLEPAVAHWWAPYEVDGTLAGLLLVDDAGMRTVTLDGVAQRRRELPEAVETVQVADDLVIVAHVAAGSRRVAAWRLPGLDPAWDVPHTHGERPFFVTGCRPLVCASVADEIWLLDPVDGSTRWQGRIGGSQPAGRGLLLSGIEERPLAMVLRDTVTSRVRLRLEGWLPVGSDGRTLVVTRSADDRAWFGAVDLARPDRMRLLGAGGPTLDRCWVGGAALVCQALLGGLDLYRFES